MWNFASVMPAMPRLEEKNSGKREALPLFLQKKQDKEEHAEYLNSKGGLKK